MHKLPRILFASDIAAIMGWETRRARRWLIRTGAGEQRGGRYVTTLSKLLAHFPEVAGVVLADAEE